MKNTIQPDGVLCDFFIDTRKPKCCIFLRKSLAEQTGKELKNMIAREVVIS